MLLSSSAAHAGPWTSIIRRGLIEVLGDSDANEVINEQCQRQTIQARTESARKFLMKECKKSISKEVKATAKKRDDYQNLIYRLKRENSKSDYLFALEKTNYKRAEVCAPFRRRYLANLSTSNFRYLVGSKCTRTGKTIFLNESSYSYKSYLESFPEARSHPFRSARYSSRFTVKY